MQAADIGQSIKQFTNEDPNHGFELGFTEALSTVLLFFYRTSQRRPPSSFIYVAMFSLL
jgi:hypothetical protein